MVRMLFVVLLTATPLSMGLKLNSASTHSAPTHPLESYTFKEFVAKHQRTYQPGSAEWSNREKIFTTNLNEVVAHRKKKDLSWKSGINKFLDWNKHEKKKVLGFKRHKQRSKFAKTKDSHHHNLNMNATIPEHIDWSNHESLQFSGPHIRDQGGCGSCWAVSTASVMEAHLEMNQHSQLVSLSRYTDFPSMELSSQSLVSCTPNLHNCGGSGGCDGATASLAFDYIMESGMPSGVDYLYTSGGGQSGSCDTTHNTVVHIQNYVNLEKNNHAQTMQALVQVGPLAMSVAAGGWFAYGSGVYDDPPSPDWDIDHAVAGFGFGNDSQHGLYWLIKNSWGPAWGENGFIRIKRHPLGFAYCGMDNTPEDGDACEGETDPVQACGVSGILYSSSYPVGVTAEAN